MSMSLSSESATQKLNLNQPTRTGASNLILAARPGEQLSADCTGHVVPGARPCALGTFSYLVTSRSYFCLSYPNRFL